MENVKTIILEALKNNQQSIGKIESAISEIQTTDFRKGIRIDPAQADYICKILKPIKGTNPDALSKCIVGNFDTSIKIEVLNIITILIGIMRGIDAHYNNIANDIDGIYYAYDISNGYIALVNLSEAICSNYFGINLMGIYPIEENIDRISDSIQLFITEGRIDPGTELMEGLKELANLPATFKHKQ